MPSATTISSVETFIISLPREVPYLGPLGPGEAVNARGPPEMGHTGVTQFMAIARLAAAFHAKVIPHAAIGVGIFQAASLHAAVSLPNVPYHEYQHSVFDKNLPYVRTTMRCEAGYFHLSEGPGLGVEPRAELWKHLLTR